MTKGDLLEIEAGKLSADIHKSLAALAVAFVAAIGTYLKAAEVPDVPWPVILSFCLFFISALCSILALLSNTYYMSKGYSPPEIRGFFFFLIVSVGCVFFGASTGFYVIIFFR